MKEVVPQLDFDYCNKLQHISTHFNTLQQQVQRDVKEVVPRLDSITATHCNALQHTAT